MYKSTGAAEEKNQTNDSDGFIDLRYLDDVSNKPAEPKAQETPRLLTPSVPIVEKIAVTSLSRSPCFHLKPVSSDSSIIPQSTMKLFKYGKYGLLWQSVVAVGLLSNNLSCCYIGSRARRMWAKATQKILLLFP